MCSLRLSVGKCVVAGDTLQGKKAQYQVTKPHHSLACHKTRPGNLFNPKPPWIAPPHKKLCIKPYITTPCSVLFLLTQVEVPTYHPVSLQISCVSLVVWCDFVLFLGSQLQGYFFLHSCKTSTGESLFLQSCNTHR